jgi:hypothetical protein
MLPSIEIIVTSFPEILFGQIVLARDTKPLSAREYQSAEFVLNQVDLSEIKHAVFITLNNDVLFWGPQYIGFPRTELNKDEIHALQQLLSTGKLFYQTPDGNTFQCVTQNRLHRPILETCTCGKEYMHQYFSYQWDAEQDHTVGVLQIYLTGSRLAEIRIYPSKQGIAYTPYETGGDWWFNGVTSSSPLWKELSARSTLSSIPVLWPEMTDSQANIHASRIIGDRYQSMRQVIQDSPSVQKVFGEIREIRPAIGNNYYSSWMDSTTVFLTFRVIGTRGEGAVIIQGYDCFNLEMVFQGIPMDDGNSYICP